MRGFTLIELMMAVAIIGALAALAVPNYRRTTCKASQTEASRGMKAVAALEESYRAEKDTYASVATSCGSTPMCISFVPKGTNPAFLYSASATTTTYTVSASGKRGSKMDGAVWQLDQTGKLSDVTGLCRSRP